MNQPVEQERNTPGTYEMLSSEDGLRPPPPSPLSGGYLLIVISEPRLETHKAVILQKISKAFLSWDVQVSGIDIEHELALVTALSPDGDAAKSGERLIQNASEHLVTEILIKPQINTLRQCVHNLLSSFTKYRYIIHAGYTFYGNGSWILEDGTFSMGDFINAFHEIEVQRVMRAYEKGIKVDVCCISEGSWNQARINQEPFLKTCRIEINPSDKLTSINTAIHDFTDYLEAFIVAQDICDVLQSSDVVGNIRFSRPTLYVFPGGDGDTALFGINGFNMLVDGGFNRGACFWNFVRHLDRLDAVLLTRINNTNIGGMSGIVQRKVKSPVYPQIGHFFSNLQRSRNLSSPDGNKDKDPLLIDLVEEGDRLVTNLKKLQLKPHSCYRESNNEPINLYHKVGHGKLDMYVLSPAKDSREVKEFLHRWHSHDVKLFSSGSIGSTERELNIPVQNLTSICALLVWQPANPEDHVTRILFPGSAPQHKVFEGFDRMKQVNFLKSPVCVMKSILPPTHAGTTVRSMKPKKNNDERISHAVTIPSEKIIPDNEAKKISSEMADNETTDHSHKKGDNRSVSQSRKYNDKALISNATKGFDMKEKHARPPAEKSQMKDSAKDTEKSAEITSRSKKLEKGAAKPSEKKSKVMGLEKKTESVKSSPTTPKKILPAKETSTKKTTNSSTVQVTTKPSPKILPGKHVKEENNQQIAETKKEAQFAKSRSSVLIAEQPSKIVSTEANKVIRKESNKPKAAITVTKQTAVANADQVIAQSVTRKTSALKTSSNKIEECKKPSKSEDTMNKATKKSAVTDTAAKELVTATAKKSSKSIAHKKVIKNENTDGSKSSITVSNIIRKEGDNNEDEILIIETTEMKPKDRIENLYEDNKYLRDEKEPEKGTNKDHENNGQVMAVGKCDDYVAPFETKSVPVLLTPEQKEDISDQLKGIISTATEIVSSSSTEFQAIANGSDVSHKTEMVQKQDSVEPDMPSSLIDQNTAATSVKITPSLEKGIEIGQPEIEEKYDTEDTKEKSSPIDDILPAKPEEQKCKDTNIYEPVYVRSDSVKNVALKTPDEVADLPIHEEVDIESTPNLNREVYKDSVLEQPVVAQVDELQLPEVVTITPSSSPDEKIEPKIISPSSTMLLENLRMKTLAMGPCDDGDAGSSATETMPQKEDVLPEVKIPIGPVTKTEVGDGTLENSGSVVNIYLEKNESQKTKAINNDESSNQNVEFPVTNPDSESSLNLEITSLEDAGSPNVQVMKVLTEEAQQKELLKGRGIIEEPLPQYSFPTYGKANISSPTNTVSLEDINSLYNQNVKNEIKDEVMSSSLLISEEDTALPTVEKGEAIKIAPDSTSKSEAAFSPSTTAPCADDEESITVPSSQPPHEDDAENSQYKDTALESTSNIISPEKIPSSSSLSVAHQKDNTPLQITEVKSTSTERLPEIEKEETHTSSPTLHEEDVSLQNTEKNCESLSKVPTEVSISPSKAVQKAQIEVIEGMKPSTSTIVSHAEDVSDTSSRSQERASFSKPTIVSHTEVVPDTSSKNKERASFSELSVPYDGDVETHTQQSTKEGASSSSPTLALEKSTLPCTDSLPDDKIFGREEGSFFSSHKRGESFLPPPSAQVETDFSEQLPSSDREKGQLSARILSEEDISSQNIEGVSQAEKVSSSASTKQDDTPLIAETSPETCTTQMLQSSDQEISHAMSSAKSAPRKSNSEEGTTSFGTAHQEDISQQSLAKTGTVDLQQSLSLDKAESHQPLATELKEALDSQNKNQQKEAASYTSTSPQKEATTQDVGQLHQEKEMKSLFPQQSPPFGEVESGPFSINIMSHSAIVESDTESTLEPKASSLHPGVEEHKNTASQLTGPVETCTYESAQSSEHERSTIPEKGDILKTIDSTFGDMEYSSSQKIDGMKSEVVEVSQASGGEGNYSPLSDKSGKDIVLKSPEVVSEKRHSVDEKAHFSPSEAIQHDTTQCDIEKVVTRVQSSEIRESSLSPTSKYEDSVELHNVELVTHTSDSSQGRAGSEILSDETKESITSEEPESSQREAPTLSQRTFSYEGTESQHMDVTVDIASKIMSKESVTSSAVKYDHKSVPSISEFDSTSSGTLQEKRDPLNSLNTSITEDITSMKTTTSHQDNAIISHTKSEQKLEVTTSLAAELEKDHTKLETTTSFEIQPEDGKEVVIKKEKDGLQEAVTSFDDGSTSKNLALHKDSSIEIRRDSSIELTNQSELESGVRRTDPTYVSDISIKNFSDSVTAKTDLSLDESKLIREDSSLGKEHDSAHEKEKRAEESLEDENYQNHPRLSTDENYSQQSKLNLTKRDSTESTSMEKTHSTLGSPPNRKEENEDAINSSVRADEHIPTVTKTSIQPENSAEVDENKDKTLSPVSLKDEKLEELRSEVTEEENLDKMMVHTYSAEGKSSKSNDEKSLDECAGHSLSSSTITHSVDSSDGGNKELPIVEEREDNLYSTPKYSPEKSSEKIELKESSQLYSSGGDPEEEIEIETETQSAKQAFEKGTNAHSPKNEKGVRSPESLDSLLDESQYTKSEKKASAFETQFEKTEHVHESVSSKFSQIDESQKESLSSECTQSTEVRDASHSKHLETQVKNLSTVDDFKIKECSNDDKELNLKLETTKIKGSYKGAGQSVDRSSVEFEIHEAVSIEDREEDESKKKFYEDLNINVGKETNKETEDPKMKSELRIEEDKSLEEDSKETDGPDENDLKTPSHGSDEFQLQDNAKEESKNFGGSISMKTTDVAMEPTQHMKSSLPMEENNMSSSTQDSTLSQTFELPRTAVGFHDIDEKTIESDQKHKKSLPSGKDVARINSVPEIKLTVEKMDASEEYKTPITSTSISTTTVTTIFKPTNHSDDEGMALFHRDEVSNAESDHSIQSSHYQSESTTLLDNSSIQTTDTQKRNSQDPIDIVQKHEEPTEISTFRDSGSEIVVGTIDDTLTHDQRSTVKYEEVKQTTESHKIFSQEMKVEENIQTSKTPAEIEFPDQDLTTTCISIVAKTVLDSSSEATCSKDTELCSPKVRTSLVATDQETVQEDDFIIKGKFEGTSILTTREEKEGEPNTKNEDNTYSTMTFSTVTSSKLEEKLTTENSPATLIPVSSTSEEERIETEEHAVQKNVELNKASTVHLPGAQSASIKQYPSTEDQSFSECSMTERKTSHLQKELTSPALQLDASAMYVKFTSGTVDSTSQKNVSMEDADMKRRSATSVLSSKANSEDTIADPEELSAILDGRDLVAKTISLPILDSNYQSSKKDEDHIDLKAASSSETDFSKSYPCLEKISTPTALSDTSSFDEQLPHRDLKSKSVSLPVIKRPDDSDKYMELPHLHKIENLEDLTSVTVTEEVNSDGTMETLTTTISAISETTGQTSASTLKHESCVIFSNIDPIKEADEPVSEDELLHSQDLASEKTTNEDVHSSTVMTTSMYVSSDESYSHVGGVSTRDIPFSMTQSIYGGFSSDDEEDQSNVPSGTTVVLPEEKKPSIEQVVERGKEPRDPIHDWGKPLGLPLTDDASNFSSLLFWNPLENWGKPYGLPSPGPPPPSTLLTPGRNNDSNGDIELNLKPINNNKAMNQKTAVKSSSGPETLKIRDASITRKTIRNNKQAPPLYVDLAYVPHHGNPYYANLEFFKRIRARYYVFSSTDPSKDVLNALLEAKKLWDNPDLEVTIIPTYDTDILGYWIAENEEILSSLKIDLAPSASRCTINLQDHDTSCSAYRLEF